MRPLVGNNNAFALVACRTAFHLSCWRTQCLCACRIYALLFWDARSRSRPGAWRTPRKSPHPVERLSDFVARLRVRRGLHARMGLSRCVHVCSCDRACVCTSNRVFLMPILSRTCTDQLDDVNSEGKQKDTISLASSTLVEQYTCHLEKQLTTAPASTSTNQPFNVQAAKQQTSQPVNQSTCKPANKGNCEQVHHCFDWFLLP